MADNSLPPVPPRRAPLIDIMRELEARPRSRRSQEFDPVAALAAERRSQSRQPLPLPPTPPAASTPPQTGETQAEAGTPPPAPDLSGVYPDIRRRLPENNPYVAAAIRIAEKYDLPPSVFLSLVQRESNFNPRAVSPRGAVGLGQLMPGTAQELGVDPRDPEANLDASARYLKQQITRFGSIPIALAAYNAGPGRVIKSGRQVPNIRETQEYVSDIMRNAGMEGYEGDQRYGFAEGGLADLDEKYADGGRVRSPAAAPVSRPTDIDYLERLVAQPIGSGEPVTEVQSAEGRGFAPIPRDPSENLQRLRAVIRGEVEPTPNEQSAINILRGFTEGPAAIKAFHGSPHRFERFDISKVGTGEGAQAQGHGLYFADYEPIARYYQESTTGGPITTNFSIGDAVPLIRQERVIDYTPRKFDPESIAKSTLQEQLLLLEPSLRGMSDDAVRLDAVKNTIRELISDGGYEEKAVNYWNRILRGLEEGRTPLRYSSEIPGHMYEVNLRVEPEELLAWDKPLNLQTDRVREALRSRFGKEQEKLESMTNYYPSGGAMRGEDFYKNFLGGQDQPVFASEQLREIGIPGVRYLDARSRSAGEGSHNYVMFGDDLIDIIRRYAKGGLAELDQKYAEGGPVRRPAAAPVASPFDAGYIERLAAQAVGAGEPVTEVRSSEGRGFAPIPRDPSENLQRLRAVIRGDVEPTPNEQSAINILRGFTEGPASIRAYHGSPHRFERFDISKIGTGEGSQAYGRGLYFAESEPVAQSYRDKLAPLGPSAGRGFGPKAIAARLLDSGASVDEAIAELNNRIRMPHIQRGLAQRNPDIMNYTSEIAEAKALLQNPNSRGHMYEVRLRTTPQELVNWNAPLVQQPERAIPFLEDILKAPRTGSARVLEREMKPIGEAVDLRTPEVAAQLREVGVPGLRYLDAGSRAGGRGTRNYVMFGDDLIDITRRYAEGGLAALDEKYAEGGTVRAPKETTIAGQDHRLAYITPEEAALLKARGGSGRMTDYGVRAYDADPGGDAQGSDPGSTDAGPTDAGPTDAGPSTDPGPTTESPGPRGGMSNEDPEGTPAAANMNTAVAATQAGRGAGIADTAGAAPTGFNAAPGIAEAIGAYSRGEISLAEAIGYGLQSGLAPPGVTPGISVDELGVQTPAISVDPLGLGLGLVGMAVGVPGLGALGGRVGSAVSQALGVAPSVFSSNPNEGPAAPSDMGGGEYLQYGQTQYGLPTQTNVASSTTPTPAAPLVDWNQIQREANALNMSVSDYLALKWRSPAAMARGGEVSLQQMLAKYADGGPVASVYDPDEINDLANQILEGADV